MAAPLSIPLILTFITGVYSLYTVSEVSVKAGALVSIPCIYSQQFRNHVKYVCEGYYWYSCLYAVTTKSQRDSDKYSISDDKNQSIFTVTIKQLTSQNAHYWCVVEIDGGADQGRYFHLSVTTGSPSLYVDDQKVTGVIGENVTINCHYTTYGQMKWCKLKSSCVTEGSGFIDGTKVTLNKSINNVFTVTLSGLSPESSGWYYCVKGDFQMPVHLTVTVKPTEASKTFTTAGPSFGPAGQKDQSSSFDMKVLIIPLSLLILLIIVASFVWFILKCKYDKAVSATSVSNEEAITYADVSFKTNKSAQGLIVEHDMDVIYSVVTAKQKSLKRQHEASAKDITYATVAHHK